MRATPRGRAAAVAPRMRSAVRVAWVLPLLLPCTPWLRGVGATHQEASAGSEQLEDIQPELAVIQPELIQQAPSNSSTPGDELPVFELPCPSCGPPGPEAAPPAPLQFGGDGLKTVPGGPGEDAADNYTEHADADTAPSSVNIASTYFTAAYRSASEYASALAARAGTCSEVCAFTGSIALTQEGRFVGGIVLGAGASTAKGEEGVESAAASAVPMMLVTAGVHAREWAAIAGMHYALDVIMSELSVGQNIPPAPGTTASILLRGEVRVAFFPLINPDGYEYSRTQLAWYRGNRNLTAAAREQCPQTQYKTTNGTVEVADGEWGVDLNRNFNGFNSFGTISVSGPCSLAQNYPGEGPFDQAETAGLRAFVERELQAGTEIVMSVDQHSFGGFVLYPYGYCNFFYCPPHPQGERVREIGERLAAAASAAGYTDYQALSSSSLYPVGGALDDWISDVTSTAYGRGGMGFTVELTNNGTFFPAPGEALRVAGEETLGWLREAIRVAAEEATAMKARAGSGSTPP